MILQALYELACSEALICDPDFEPAGIAWGVRIKSDGSLVNIEPLKKSMIVPKRMPSRSGKKPPAEFAVDNPLYALGLSIPVNKYTIDECKKRNQTFRKSIHKCYKSTGDTAARAICRFLVNLHRHPTAVDVI